MPNSKQIVYLSQAQYAELIANGTITVDGVTVTYDENDIYVTPQAEPVTDVRINGTSIAANGVANVPLADADTYGVMKLGTGLFVQDYGGGNKKVRVGEPSSGQIKVGTHGSGYISPMNQHESAFYGLAKASGDTTQSQSNNAVGTYTPEAKGAIQQMLGISNLLAPSETATASKAYSIGEVFTSNGKLYKATAAIAAADAIVTQDAGEEVSGSNAAEVKLSEYAVRDVQVNGTSVLQNGVANIPVGSTTEYGVLKAEHGLTTYEGRISVRTPNDTQVKEGYLGSYAVVLSKQHASTFYGLAKAAGADMASIASTTVGIYPDAQKAAIQHMLGTDTNLASYESDTTAD